MLPESLFNSGPGIFLREQIDQLHAEPRRGRSGLGWQRLPQRQFFPPSAWGIVSFHSSDNPNRQQVDRGSLLGVLDGRDLHFRGAKGQFDIAQHLNRSGNRDDVVRIVGRALRLGVGVCG